MWQAHDLEQQLHDAHSQQQALSASNKQLEQQKDRLDGQLHKAQKECQDARTQLQDSKAAFEEENTSLHSLASRHKEERVSLENDKQALDGLVRELAQKAEVRTYTCSCTSLALLSYEEHCGTARAEIKMSY